jgi:hypothetical protein
MSRDEQIERALHQALACREDRKRAEEALAAFRREEEAAIERLQAIVYGREAQKDGAP